MVSNNSYMMNCGTSECFKRNSFEIFWYEEERVCQSFNMIYWDIWMKSCQSAIEEQKLSRLKSDIGQTLDKLSSMKIENWG